MVVWSRVTGFTKVCTRINCLQGVCSNRLYATAHQSVRCCGDIVEGLEVFIHTHDIVSSNGENRVNVWSNLFLISFLFMEIGLCDPSGTLSNFACSYQISVSLESASDTVHEISLVEFCKHSRFVIGLQCMVSNLAGVYTGQQVSLVTRVNDEATTLCSTTKTTNSRVSEHVSQ